MNDVDDARRRSVLERMQRARVFEEMLGVEFARQRDHAKAAFGGRNSAFEDYNRDFRIPIQGNLELSIGQEVAPSALCVWLTDDDYVGGTHRSHSLAVAKGVGWKSMLAEIYGRSTGLCGGRAGDFMLNDSRVNFENSAIMAQLTAVAAGHAFFHQRKQTGGLAAVFIGDGASNQGVVHETMNLASLWKLPLILVIEDNGYAISTPRRRGSAVEDLSVRSRAYDMPGVGVDDRDVDVLIEAFGSAVDRARAGAGPSLVVSRTHRLRGAFEGDSQAYRPEGELERETRLDALPQYSARLVESGVVSPEWIVQVNDRAREDFAEALAFAEASPYPDPRTAAEGLFA
ncbi:thiamine pyrophosphate-dependent dehydrogenase E1 component subunit alpha [Nocardioides sp. LMS-CY]|uniref:thiamine pyrophosphate-dependent dehydrogenase E1 component subunit alpha n=1 Tax=Nocardioides sp. (strain LMS-CY) TaxID=2840457 RepID=UPI001C008E9A|nr:thiamine pyrophosphate-dependent dehydrogenase E1 component subunit alpha [Nocardioides sp. LMS-CY]QWF22959.1 thiamine pyrophosphate-dependent dehydrogenase E1 component subunit alpha [Nocardioides sp. LMS-CY]